MRKLKPSEVAVLVAGLAIGSGNIEATEDEPIATVVVTATRVEVNVRTRFTFSSGYVPYSAAPVAAGVITDPTVQDKYRRGVDCAIAYGATRGAVPRADYVTYLSDNYGWLQNGETVFATATNQPPPGTGFEGLQGVTTHHHPGYPTIKGQSKIFVKSHEDLGALINTIAHEWVHQHQPWGQVNEDEARLRGDIVEQEWRWDAGSKCGGL
jgi:hypothetical protein